MRKMIFGLAVDRLGLLCVWKEVAVVVRLTACGMRWVRHPILGIKATEFTDKRAEEKLTKAKTWQSRSSTDSRKASLKRDC